MGAVEHGERGGGMQGMQTARICHGEGKFALEAQVVVMKGGITATVCSPGFAHVGATAQAIPRPEEDRTATVSILAVPCHRDEIPAHDLAAALATRFRVPAVASCGLHVEGASREDLQQVLATTRELTEKICAYVERALRASWDEGGQVVAVTPEGAVLGPVDRIEAHTGAGILHQAFSIMLVEGSGGAARLVLCRRSPAKRLWGGVLADACAGHPLPGEELDAAAARRLEEELGLDADAAPLTRLGHIVYREDHGDGGCEHEWCAVYAGRLPAGGAAALAVNEQEVSEVRPVPLGELAGYLEGEPEPLAPWLALALRDEGIAAGLRAFAGASA